MYTNYNPNPGATMSPEEIESAWVGYFDETLDDYDNWGFLKKIGKAFKKAGKWVGKNAKTIGKVALIGAALVGGALLGAGPIAKLIASGKTTREKVLAKAKAAGISSEDIANAVKSQAATLKSGGKITFASDKGYSGEASLRSSGNLLNLPVRKI